MTTNELEAIARRIESAASPEDLFGPLDPPASAQRDAVALAYRATVKVVHPDHFVGTLAADRSVEVFRKLTSLKDRAIAKIAAGSYGKPDVDEPTPTVDSGPVIVETKKTKYMVGDLVAKGDYADLYACTWMTGSNERTGLFKLVRSAGDNDLALNEATVLGKLFPASQEEEKAYRFLPRMNDSFELRSKSSRRRVVVLDRYPEHVSFAQIIKAYPNGIDFRDAVWMFKRLLYCLGFVHRQGIIHGAVIPSHVLVHPTEHGLRLVDWSAALMKTDHVRLMSPSWKGCYPEEVLKKQTATSATDIFMAATCIGGMLEDPYPKEIRRFLEGCLISNQKRRPDDAWALHEDFDELLKRVVGKPTYRAFRMPDGKK